MAAIAACAIAMALGCDQPPNGVVPPGGDVTGNPDIDGPRPDTDGDGIPDGADPGEPESFGPENPAPSTRFARLTKEQWENAVRDLLRLDTVTGFSSELAQDAIPAEFLFDNAGESLNVDGTQWSGFQRAAQRAAELVTTDATLRARIAPEGTDAASFIAELGRRAHRRPLTADEVAAYLLVHDAGEIGFAPIDPAIGGIRLVIEAMLQSPYFLYRIEESGTVVDDAIPLDQFEIAARLSFALWNSMPDDELFEAARDGLLTPEGVEAQARRMLDDDKARAAMLSFHAQLLEAEKLAGVAPAPAFFPDAPANLGELARTENDLFLADLFTNGGGLAEMLTSTTTFANADLARIYGLDPIALGLGEEFVPVELDPAVRKGILTHVAFLTQNATSVDPDPIHRGVFIARHMMCTGLSAPPADIPPLPPQDELQTNRDRVAAHTEQTSPCIDCHKDIINPYGFPFEMYDATGAFRTHDNGLPVNTQAEPLLDEGPTPVEDALGLAQGLSESRYAHECYAEHWLQFTMGRTRREVDVPLIGRVGAVSRTGGGIKDLMVEIVTSPAFLQRSVEELDGGAP